MLSAGRAGDGSKEVCGTRGTYALLESIGRGAFGTVYKAIRREDGLHVAVKRVERARVSADEEAALRGEIELFQHLDHERIVDYVEAVDVPESPYLDVVMEYVEGGSLFGLVQKLRLSARASGGEQDFVLPERTVAIYVAQVLEGLCYLHDQGVVHRDIKGANILITKNIQVKLADFGVSTRRGAEAGPADELDVQGTPYWMAPEIISLSGCSTVSDIWSVGCTVVELLTGFPPYHKLSDVTALFRIVTDECPPLPEKISAECQNFLRACFVKDMNARATAAQLLLHPWLTLHGQGRSAEPDPGEREAEGNPLDGFAEDDAWNGDADQNGRQEGLTKYEEGDDDDFDDFDFGEEEENGDGGAPHGHLVAVEEPLAPHGDEEDPFKGVLDDPEAEKETERLRKHRELWQRVKTQSAALGTSPEAHINACNQLVSIFAVHPEQRYSLIYDPGLLPILDVLESGGIVEGSTSEDVDVVEAMLRVSLSLLETPEEPDGERGPDGEAFEIYLGYPRVSNIRHDMCLAGFLPAVIRYCDRSYPLRCRMLAACFLEEMLAQQSTLHMFAACRGFTVFVDMLEPDTDSCGELLMIALNGIETLLSMEKQRHKRDFCRRLAGVGLLERIVQCTDFSATRLMELSESSSDGSSTKSIDRAVGYHFMLIVKLASLLQTFAARADPIVKAKMCVPAVIGPSVRHIVSRYVPQDAVQSILCCVRDLSRDPQTHDALEEAHAISVLVQYLSGCPRTEENTKTRHYIVSCLHNLCIVSPARQESASIEGLVPHLQACIRSNDINLRSLCIDIYSGLACAGRATRIELAKHAGADFYVELLTLLSVPGTVRKWQARVLQSLADWLDDSELAADVEEKLVATKNCDQVCTSLAQTRLVDLEPILEPYRCIIAGSMRVNRVLGNSRELISAMVSWLEQLYDSKGSVGGARERLLLIQIILNHARAWTRTERGPMTGLISALRILLSEKILADERAVTVREKANRLLSVLNGQ